MQTDLFAAWFEHFLNFVKPTADDPVLLILDGHSTHTKNITFLERAREKHTTVVCLPPHCSHKLQPLNVSFMQHRIRSLCRSLKNFFETTLEDQLLSFKWVHYLSKLIWKVNSNNWNKCISPLDPSVFSNADFAPAEVTDQPKTSNSTDQPGI